VKVPTLIVSHGILFALCFAFGKSFPKRSIVEETSASTKSQRIKSSGTSRRAQEVLANVLPQESEAYKTLAEAIALDTDFATQVTSLLDRVQIRRTANAFDLPGDSVEEVNLLNEIHAHVHQWLQSDPEALITYLKKNGQYSYILNKGPTNAILDHVSDTGFINNLELIRSIDGERSMNHFFLNKALAREFEAGASLTLLDQLDKEFGENSFARSSLLYTAASHASFENGDALLERILSSEKPNATALRSFLRNPNHPQKELVSWTEDLLGSDVLPKEVEKRVRGIYAWWLKGVARDLPPQERIDLAHKYNGGDKGGTIDEACQSDVSDFLNKGELDYRYQFRHGRLSSEEILADLKSQQPEMLAAYPKEILSRLYQELAEEDPLAAVSILDQVNEPDWANTIRYDSASTMFANISPDVLLAQSQSLPRPNNESEEENRYSAWKNRSDDLLTRHGEDFVQWIIEMPSGPDKDSAIRWTSKYAQKIFPERAEAIAAQLDASQK